MNRLTSKMIDKIYLAIGKYATNELNVKMETSEIIECMEKLRDYEDTGLEPSEIVSLKNQAEKEKLYKEFFLSIPPNISEPYNESVRNIKKLPKSEGNKYE